MSAQSPAYPPYPPHRNSQSLDLNAPPAPPPKPNSQEVSRRGTPAGGQHIPPPLLPTETLGTYGTTEYASPGQQGRLREIVHAQDIQDPGDQWLPKILEDKSSVTLRI